MLQIFIKTLTIDNESYIVCLKAFGNENVFTNLILLLKSVYVPFHNCNDYVPIWFTL